MYFKGILTILLIKIFHPVFSLNEDIKYINTTLNFVSEDNSALQCATKIWKKYRETYTLVISNNEHFSYDMDTTVLLYSENGLRIDSSYYRFNMFVFIMENVDNLKKIMNTIYNSVYWNSKAKFLIVYLGEIYDINDIFEITWYYFTLNLSVVANNGTCDNVYIFFPYKDENCAVYNGYEEMSSCEENTEIYPQKIPLNLHGCSVKLMAYWMPPYVINLNAPREKPALAGIEVTAIHVLKERMNFTENYIVNPYAHWGHKYDDGHYTFMYKDLLDRKIDLIYGFTYGNSSYIFDFDTSYCYLDDKASWLVPIALPMAQWKNLTAIFEWKLWIIIFVMLTVNGISWWFIGKNREKSDEFNDLILCIMHSLYTLLQGSVRPPQKGNLRIVFFLWLLSSLLIFTAHQCQLISILTSPLYDKQIKTLEDLMASDLQFGFFPSLAEPYMESDHWIHKKLVKDYVQCPVTVECVNRTAFQRDFAVIKNKRQIRYLTPRYYTTHSGQKMLYETEEVAFHVKHRFHMIKGLPLYERIDKLAMLLESSGLISKWDSDLEFKVIKIESEPDHKALSLNHLQGAFFIWGFGILFSTTVFICEKILSLIK